MQVHELMTKEPVVCTTETSLREAAQLMQAQNVGCLVVLRGQQVAGICTDRDLVLALAEKGPDCDVSDAMAEEVGCVRPDDSLLHLVDVFRSAGVVRRLPVVDDQNRPVGIVSLSDVSMVAEDLVNALFLEERKNARSPHLLTGAKEFAKRLRSPTKHQAQEPRLEPVRPHRPRR